MKRSAPGGCVSSRAGRQRGRRPTDALPPSRLAGWARREAVLAPGREGTGLAARTARSRQRGRRLRASGGGGDDGLPRRKPTGLSALAVEQAGDRAVAEYLVDRPGQQR